MELAELWNVIIEEAEEMEIDTDDLEEYQLHITTEGQPSGVVTEVSGKVEFNTQDRVIYVKVLLY